MVNMPYQWYLMWSHITHIYEEGIEYGLKLLPKITGDHVKLALYSAIRVPLAVQILSTSMSTLLKEYGPEEAQGTDFCQMMDMVFGTIRDNTRLQIWVTGTAFKVLSRLAEIN